MRFWCWWIAACGAVAAALPARGEMPGDTPAVAAAPDRTIPYASLAGEQFWSDELVYHGWRIQQNALTPDCRLLDPQDICRQWGSFQICRDTLEEAKRRSLLPPLNGRAVITMHGLYRSREQMEGLGEYLAEQGGYHCVNVAYASSRRSLDEHAQSLAHVIEGLEGLDELNFVCHSLGNLVVRRYLGEAERPEPKWRPDPRIKRMVMLGPPNNGAQLAEAFKNNDLLGLFAGPSGKQLGRTWDETQKLLATPTFPFAIVAGGRGAPQGLNPLLNGDNDLIVSVAETQLPGACDFRLVPCWHGGFMNDAGVRQAVANFLAHGCFSTEAERQPITKVTAAKVPLP